jgi:alkylated DNA nucleotide flippase Atl1
MPYRRKTWEEKLKDSKDFPKTLKLATNFPCYRALEKMGAKPGDSVVLAPPLEVDAVIRQVPEGKLITLRGICEQLAEQHQTQYCCTLTTGIFINIVANASEEMKRDVPYWRTIKNDGQLNDKFPGGSERHKQLLENEGHKAITRGRKHIKYFLKDFEQSLLKV